MECAMLFFLNSTNPVISNILPPVAKMGIFFPPLNAKLSTLFLITIVAIGSKPKKDKDLNIVNKIAIPIIIGLIFIFSSLYFVDQIGYVKTEGKLNFTGYQIAYMLMSFCGAFLTQVGADNISKIIQTNMGKDRWNTDEESFAQNQALVDTDHSINIPYQFRYNKKINKGFININPFRGVMVIGVPGSGKSYGIINPAIRQLIKKGFSFCIYDFKYPDLAKIAYYHYILKVNSDRNYKHKFHVINLDDVDKSRRVNPLKKEFVNKLSEAQDMAEAMVSSLQKGGGSAGGGSEAFFTQSAINFLACCIYFFATYQNGKFSDLPHLLSFMNKSYKEIFDTLFEQEELVSLLSPFQTAYENKAFEQLEGQIGTLKIFISRLATKESFWVFSADEVNLKVSDPNDPSIIVLASNPDTQDINSALFSAVLNRTLKQINSKHNLPCAVIADEFPTIYIHKIENIVATARSNKVGVILGLQEIPQLKQYYKKEVADTISAIMGTILSGSVRDKNTLDWLERMFGKVKQKSYSQSISSNGTTTSINEKLDNLIPAGKIASLRTGEMVGMVALGNEIKSDDYVSSAINGKITLDQSEIEKEEKNYKTIPHYFSFKDQKGIDRKEEVLITNFRRINNEVDLIVAEHIK